VGRPFNLDYWDQYTPGGKTEEGSTKKVRKKKEAVLKKKTEEC